MKKRFLYPFVLLLLLASCEQPVLEQAVYSEDLFLKDQYVLNPLGDSFSFTVNAVGMWSLSKPDWLSASRLSGRGMQIVTLNAEANKTGRPLTGEIVVNSSEVKRIQVSQANPYAFLEDNEPFYFKWNRNVDDEGGSQKPVSVRSNLYWKLVPDGDAGQDDKFSLSVYEGFGDATVSVSPKMENLDTQEWRASFRLTCYVDSARTQGVDGIQGVEVDSIIMLQRNYEFLMNGEPSASVVFERSSFKTESFTISLDPNAGASPSWSVVENTGNDWLKVTKSNASTLELVPSSANVTKYDRSCQVTLEANSGARRHIDVRQEKYFFYFLRNGQETDLLNFDNTGGTHDVSFVSSGPWRMEGSMPAGVEFNPTSGEEGETPVQVTISQQNLSLNTRTSDIVVRSDDPALSGIVLKDTLSLRQKEFTFQITQKLDTLGSAEGSSKTFVLQSSGPWQIDYAPDWVEVSPSSLESEKGGSTPVTVRALSENTSETNHRSSIIRVVCPLNSSALRREFPVIQMRTLFDLSENSFPSIRAYEENQIVCTATLTSTQNWEITDIPIWITASQKIGSASGKPVTLSFYVDTNKDKNSRSGRVIIKNQSGKTRQINFTQEGIYFSISGNNFTNQPAAGATKQTEVTCYPTVSWSVNDVPRWVSVSPSSGKGNGTVTFTIQPNAGSIDTNGSEERSGSAVIENGLTHETASVSFSQAGYRWSVTNASTYTFGAFKGDKTPEFTITASGSWQIETPDWLSASRTQGSGGTDRITLTCIKDNAPAPTTRNATVTIVCNDFASLNKSINVQQEKYNLTASPSSQSFSKKKDQTATITITADGAWTAKTDATSWLSVSPTSGPAGTTTVILKTLSKNNGSSSREAKVTITDSKHPTQVSATVTVTQSNK